MEKIDAADVALVRDLIAVLRAGGVTEFEGAGIRLRLAPTEAPPAKASAAPDVDMRGLPDGVSAQAVATAVALARGFED